MPPMIIGYSLLLREYVNADQIDYGDCAQFQVTCPHCHEAIFKSGKLNGDRQFLSHYAASKSDVAQCELRVKAISQTAIAHGNIMGHGQTMEHFFSHFREFILNWFFEDEAANVKRRIQWMIARPSFILYANYFGVLLGHGQRGQTANYLGSRESLKSLFLDDRSPFWVERQFAFSRDFEEHLLAPNSKSAFSFLVAIAILIGGPKLPGDFAGMFTAARDAPLAKFLQKQEANRKLHHFNAYLVTIMDFFLMTIPYVDMLAGKTGDKENRKLFAELLVDTIEQIREREPTF